MQYWWSSCLSWATITRSIYIPCSLSSNQGGRTFNHYRSRWAHTTINSQEKHIPWFSLVVERPFGEYDSQILLSLKEIEADGGATIVWEYIWFTNGRGANYTLVVDVLPIFVFPKVWFTNKREVPCALSINIPHRDFGLVSLHLQLCATLETREAMPRPITIVQVVMPHRAHNSWRQ